ncbi:unnamed protein product [Clavelina lepadiformis]|uniref:protein xylosyltransferase n=1 Tax=Clavelina lepadiformis TaxID=159417 RepID=A0ABP0FUN2_CLALP
MGLTRSLKRIYRKWKIIVFILGIVLLVQFLLILNSSPGLEEEQLRRAKEIQVKHQQVANAVLQGKRPHLENAYLNGIDILNPKDPKFREEFLKHSDNRVGILEDGDLKINNENKDIAPPSFEDDQFEEAIFDENFKFNPVCEVTLKDAQSAISRAKSQQCKQTISDVACKMQGNSLFPESMPRTCPHDFKFAAEAPIPAHFSDNLKPIRICYILVVHGRAFRQFRRLLRVLYHRDHYYYIHVDKRSDYLLREIVKETAQYPNVKVAPWRMATIWGGSSLLQMLLHALTDVLSLWTDWDFFINLSALDFPIEHNDKLIKFLSTYHDKNFMKSHGREDEKFIRKQGLNRVFVECDQHMWRLGERELPKGITVNGGSDWVAMNRRFCEHIIRGKDKLLADLKHWYRYTLLPAESFFHTYAQNSDKCESFVDNNLRVTNWNRARGCKCQYKHIVDWCGCSPNDFFPSDLVRLQTTRPVFFARKFEEIINQEVVNHLDFKLYGEYPPGTPGLQSYWESCYDNADGPTSISDSRLTHYASFTRIGLSMLNHQLALHSSDGCQLVVKKLNQVEIYKRSEEFVGYLATIDASWKKPDPNSADIKLQVFISPRTTFRMIDSNSQIGHRLEGAVVGTEWDVKELTLRDWRGVIGPNDEPRLVARWRKSDEDFVVTIVVVDPLNVVADYNDFRTPSKAAGVTETPLSLRKPLRPGRWVVRFYVQRQFQQVCAEVDFYVTPLEFVEGRAGDTKLSEYNRGVEDDGQLNAANRNLYSVRTTLSLTKDLQAARDLVSSSLSLMGTKLHSWVDGILGSMWQAKDVCLISTSPESWQKSQPGGCDQRHDSAPNLCHNMNWSSFSPDPKSELGKVKPNGRIR